MIKNSFFIAAAVAGLFASSISAQAATCPVTGATTEEKGSKKEESKDAKDNAKSGEAKGGCSGCPSKK